MNAPFTLMINALYPPRCPICHDIVQPATALVCPSCAACIHPIIEPRCKKCGKPVADEETEYCPSCEMHPHFYEQGIGIFTYSAVMQQSIARWKFGGRREYTAFYNEAMWRFGRDFLLRINSQLIIPVPVHPRKMRMRGYNQAELLARPLGEKLHVPVRTDIVRRVVNTKAQKELDIRERHQNLRHAFSVSPGIALPPRVLLVDDIYTTGSTIDAIARLLLERGTRQVYFISLCVGAA